MAYLMFQCPTQGPIGDQVDLAPRESDLRAGLLYRSNGKKPLISDDSHHRVGANKGPVGKQMVSSSKETKYVYAIGVGLEASKDWHVPQLNTANVKRQDSSRFFSVDTVVQSQQQSCSVET